MLRSACVAFCALFLALPAARAADPGTLTSKTKAAEITVTFDDTVRVNPRLAADLVAEGRRWIAAKRAEADKAWENAPERFGAGRRWKLTRDYAAAAVIARHYVSVLRTDTLDTGGAHPFSEMGAVLWDTIPQKRASIRTFFKETADDGPTMKAILFRVLVALKAEKLARKIEPAPGFDWSKGVEPKMTRIGAVTLAPSTEPGFSSGLIFHYPPATVGAHVEGSYEAFVPWESLRALLSPEGAAIFGGSRPPRDANL